MRFSMLSFSTLAGAVALPSALILISSPLPIVTIDEDCFNKTVTVPSRAITRRSSAALGGISIYIVPPLLAISPKGV